MSIIMKNGKYINTDTPEENKKTALREVGAKITAQSLKADTTIKFKKKSTKILLRTQTVLKKAAAAWPARSDLREVSQEVDEAVVADDLKNHTKTFVQVLRVLEKIIPLWTGEQMLQLTKLQKLILLRNQTERERKHDFTEASPVDAKIKNHLTKGDVNRWLNIAKKGQRLIYYTGHTFSSKDYQQQKVFAYVRDLCFSFAPSANSKKFYTSKGGSGGEWGVKYHNVITLFQQVVAPEQKDENKNIITHKVYNYIMEKL